MRERERERSKQYTTAPHRFLVLAYIYIYIYLLSNTEENYAQINMYVCVLYIEHNNREKKGNFD